MEKVLEVIDLKKYFPVKTGFFKMNRKKLMLKAVDGVSFSLQRGETLGIVGESGSGKSTVGRTILKLTDPTAGRILYRDQDITSLKGEELRVLRKQMQMIFQDPYASLNPRMTVGACIEEPILEHSIMSKKEAKERVCHLLDKVGLDGDYYFRFPHQFSGGQRQRIGIARALSLEPEVIIADEPVSALDVSVQAQIINLFKDLQKEFMFSYIFIAHDLSVVKYISDRIAVMYLGEIVEICCKDELFNNYKHPYTQALISAIPVPDPRRREERIILSGDIPNPANPPDGCRFSTRCFRKMDICDKVHPEFIDIGNHQVRCHIYSKGGDDIE